MREAVDIILNIIGFIIIYYMIFRKREDIVSAKEWFETFIIVLVAGVLIAIHT